MPQPASIAQRLRALFGREPRRHPACRVDEEGCPACGGAEFAFRPILGEDLARTWELTPGERAWFDDREGHHCVACGASRRVRSLVWSLRRSFPDPAGLRVLHLNEVPGLESALPRARMVRTFFEPGTPALFGRIGSVRADMRRLPFAGGSFDLVVHSDTVEHIFEWQQALDEAERVLRPGGLQVYTLPVVPGRRSRARIEPDGRGGMRPTLPPSYHGEGDHFLVAWEFGEDWIRSRSHRLVRLDYDDLERNPTVFTAVESRPGAGAEGAPGR